MNDNRDMNNRMEYYDEYEIDLREYIMLIWEHKWFITAFVIIAVLAAFFVSTTLLNPQYESTADLAAPNYELVNGKALNREDYVLLFNGDDVVNEVLDFINQNRTEDNIISSETLLNNATINVSENSNQINFSYKYNDPELTAETLELWVNSFIKTTKQLINRENNEYISGLRIKSEQDYSNYKKKLDTLSEFQSKNNLSLLRKELRNKEDRILVLKNRNNELETNLEASKTKLTTINNNLQEIDRFFVKKNSIDEAFLQKMRIVYPEDELITLLNTEEEFLNPEYKYLITSRGRIRSNIESLNTEISLNAQEITSLNSEIKILQEKYAELTQQEELLKKELDNSEDIYNLSKQNYNNAKQELADKNYNIYVLSSPKVPQNPVSPNIKLNIAIAAVLALMLAVFIIFFKEFMKEEK